MMITEISINFQKQQWTINEEGHFPMTQQWTGDMKWTELLDEFIQSEKIRTAFGKLTSEQLDKFAMEFVCGDKECPKCEGRPDHNRELLESIGINYDELFRE